MLRYLVALVCVVPVLAAHADTFLGSAACSSSGCHGGAGQKRSQFITWSRLDFHSRAYVVLTSARSARMAESLSIGAATTSARCTTCHSPFAGLVPTRLQRNARADEGVSCENCHGAAESWLRGHTRRDWSYATRLGAGMRDLRSLYGRANACVACHQNLDPDLLSAGHPELLFELDSQSVAEPRHWRDEDPWIGARSWLTGQAVALRESSWSLAQRPNDEREKLRWSALGWLLAKVVGVQTDATASALNANTGDFTEMQRVADALARSASQWSFDRAFALRLLRSFAGSADDFAVAGGTSEQLLARRAERLVPAIDRLALAVGANGGASLPIEAEMTALRADVSHLAQFDPSRFAAHLQALAERLR